MASRGPASTSRENILVVRRRHLRPPDTSLGANVGVTRTTSKLLVLVELLNLTFDLELDVERDPNVKFAPLVLGQYLRVEIREPCVEVTIALLA
ncbi:hypothetical protein CHELA40_50479 [Chelatococcus asaccharovorans]|nr:hypothetical protein CHELA17_20445 [Chelatococcus asaccharovorans]CAH1692995.1 hypothetical protein CHELA40_50479 [Chelatococcus asaccharovorans]